MKSHFVLTSVFAFALVSACSLVAAQQNSTATQPSGAAASQESKPVEPSAQTNTKSGTTRSSAPSSKKKKSKSKTKKAAQTGPRRVVVRGGSTAETGGTLSAGLSHDEAAHQREKTVQLLRSADTNLKRISGRQLTASQQDAIRQINMYMEQSKTATQDGDLQRARTLAEKAHLLSDALTRE